MVIKMKTPVLETERVILRPLKITDAEDVFNNWAGDPEVTQYLRYNTHETVDVTKEWLISIEENDGKTPSYIWGLMLKETGELFGSFGLFYSQEHKMFEIGYCIMKKYWNNGLTTEAARAVIDFAVKELKQTTFFVCHAKENTASGRIIEKLGFVYHGDGEYSSVDRKRVFQSREYFLHIK